MTARCLDRQLSVFNTPRDRLSYNFLYWFKAARSAPRARQPTTEGQRKVRHS
jgi:hypothetical protein